MGNKTEYMKIYYQQHKELWKRYSQKPERKEYDKRYYLEHRDERREKKKIYAKEHSEERRIRKKAYRHRVGISKKYNSELGTSHTKEYRKERNKEYRKNNKEKIRLLRKRYKYLKKNAGNLPIKRIQQIYEDNIKKYGTLTCYLCEKPIIFGDDSLEHKTPLSRGGTNSYDNLDVAHIFCNRKKYTKTYEEYILIK